MDLRSRDVVYRRRSCLTDVRFRELSVVQRAVRGNHGGSSSKEVLLGDVQEPVPFRGPPLGRACNHRGSPIGRRIEGAPSVVHDTWKGNPGEDEAT